MQSRIEEHIVTRLQPIITPSYMYDEQGALPYCVYEVENLQPIMAKRGPIGYTASVSIYLVAKSEAESVSLKDNVLNALAEKQAGFVINVDAVQPAFAEDKWLQKIDINVKQL